jgi:hypothetical protein
LTLSQQRFHDHHAAATSWEGNQRKVDLAVVQVRTLFHNALASPPLEACRTGSIVAVERTQLGQTCLSLGLQTLLVLVQAFSQQSGRSLAPVSYRQLVKGSQDRRGKGSFSNKQLFLQRCSLQLQPHQ